MSEFHAGPPPETLRHRLPDERASITHRFEIGGTSGHLIVGLYPDGRPGEIFVNFAKAGQRQRVLLDAWATMVSIGLQSGITVETIVAKFKAWKCEPAGLTRSENIPICLGPLDYICKWLEWRFCEGLTNADEGLRETLPPPEEL